MNPTGWLIAGIVVLALIGVSQIIWPRWFAWLQQLGMYRETAEPSAFLIGSIRIAGVIIVVGSLVAIGMIAAVESRTSDARDAEATRDAETVELERDLQMITDATDACRASIAVLAPAVQVDADGTILNVDELEALAEQEGVALRPWAEEPSKTLIVTFDGISMYALPTADQAGPCAELGQRLLLDQ